MMIREHFQKDVYIADFTEYNKTAENQLSSFSGIVIGEEDNGVIPSFLLTNENGVSFAVVNNERNIGFYTRPNGEKVSQCECIVYADRNDHRKGWMVFLELKYCKAKNIYRNMLEGISQLRDTCHYVLREKQEYDESQYRKYLVISTPGVEPLPPFDASYFDQDFLLAVKERTGAILIASNCGHIKTPAIVDFE